VTVAKIEAALLSRLKHDYGQLFRVQVRVDMSRFNSSVARQFDLLWNGDKQFPAEINGQELSRISDKDWCLSLTQVSTDYEA